MSRPFRFAVQSSSAASATEWRDRARKAEDLGYSTLLVADHYIGPGTIAKTRGVSPQGFAPWVAMAVAAAATTTLRVGSRVLCIDYHHPAALAKEAATLDLLSDGRFELGLGAGWTIAEYEAMGLAMDDAPTRIKRLEEVIALVKAHFSGDEIDVRGDHVQVFGYQGTPAPVQKPGPPIFIGGGARKVLQLAGREADIVSFNFNNRAGVIGAEGVSSSTAENMEQKVAWVREGAGDRFDQIELEIGAYFTAVTDDAPAAAEGLAKMFGLSTDDVLAHPNAYFGTVDQICETLQQRREHYGFSYVTVADRNMEMFAPVVARLAGK